MLNEIEGLNGSTAAYVPGVCWNSIEGCYRSIIEKIQKGCSWDCGGVSMSNKIRGRHPAIFSM
jgi:hypothetical protein